MLRSDYRKPFSLLERTNMSALLEMEPRLAGADVMEPEVEFEKKWDDLPVDCILSAPHQTVPATTPLCTCAG
jgi:hypothetical protein